MSLPSEYRNVATKTETYAWSGDGVRLTATSGNGPSGTARFLVDRAFDLPTVALERDGNGKLVRRYTYGLDLLAQTTPTKGPYWYHHDGLGSVTDVTSSSGTSLWWMEYTPLGAPRASASTSQSPTNLFRFTGEYADTPTALYHLRARQYDPSTGRFLSTDPVSQAIGDPSVGSYVYVRDNPTNRTDPSGRFGPEICFTPWTATWCIDAATIAAAALLSWLAGHSMANVQWPLRPTGTLQERLFTNPGPQPPPQPNRPWFKRCTPMGVTLVCVTVAGLTIVYYNWANQQNATPPQPTPQPAPPPEPSPASGQGSK
ncbi:MAG: RHS repeat-associated core domain-containing protein [Actinobacteria bacterium]|nr:RHS repeat-associated core domain-containing protein [Actinomycetota bacterium]